MSEFPVVNDKPAWRAWARQKRSATALEAITPLILANIARLTEWKSAKHILLYLSFAGELPVERLAYDAGKNFYLPRCAPEHQLTIHPFIPDVTPLLSGAFGLREPDPIHSPEVSAETLDLVVVPGLMFSENGMRLGYGGGYYDRFLKRIRPDCGIVGAIIDDLLVPELPGEPHDVPVRIVVTQTRILRTADMTEPTPRPYSD